MKQIFVRLIDLIKKGEIKFLLKGVTKRIYSKNRSFYLKRDLKQALSNAVNNSEFTMRKATEQDAAFFVTDLQNEGLLEMHISQCYVLVNKKDTPCHRLWLMGYNQSSKIQSFWGDSFPLLQKDEAIVESVFTTPQFRGHNLLSKALCEVENKAILKGYRTLIAFVDIHNSASLKGFHRSDYYPYMLRQENWFLFKKTVTFKAIPDSLLADYYKEVQ